MLNRLRSNLGWIITGIFLLAPLLLSTYDLSILGRFMALSILGIGISLIWGYTGILSLGQGVFFGLGGYALAMHLKLIADQGMPDFMLWNQVAALPWWWEPFHSGVFSLGMVLALPMLASGGIAWLVFNRRITGVYFALITQALALAFSTLLVSQQGLTGGFNGLTNFSMLFGFPLAAPNVRIALFYITLGLLVSCFWFGRWLLKTHLGKLLVAIRDGESRVRFLGYDPAAYKVFAFSVSGAMAGLAGALYTLHVGVISPAMVGVVPSIEMVVWVALGGRDSLAGAVLGTLVGNVAKDRISSALPEFWLYVIGALFILVVTGMPKGLVGLFGSRQRKATASDWKTAAKGESDSRRESVQLREEMSDA